MFTSNVQSAVEHEDQRAFSSRTTLCSLSPPCPRCVFLLQDSSFILGEELGLHNPAHSSHDPAPSTPDSSFLAVKAGSSREPGEELDLSFLPDELGAQDEPSRHDNTGMTSPMMLVFNKLYLNRYSKYTSSTNKSTFEYKSNRVY